MPGYTPSTISFPHSPFCLEFVLDDPPIPLLIIASWTIFLPPLPRECLEGHFEFAA